MGGIGASMEDKMGDRYGEISRRGRGLMERKERRKRFERLVIPRIESWLFARNGKRIRRREIGGVFSRYSRKRRGEASRAEGVYWLASNSGLGYGQLTSVTGWQVEIVLGVKSISRVDDRDLVAFLTFSFYRHRGKARVLTRN